MRESIRVFHAKRGARRARATAVAPMLLLYLLSCWVLLLPMTSGFRALSATAARRGSTRLHYNRFGAFGDFLNFNRTKTVSSDDDDDERGGDTAAAGTYNLVTLPVSAIKPGGLRLFLMLYLAGLQNTPDPQSWKADQPSRDEYVVDMYFHDHSAALSVELEADRRDDYGRAFGGGVITIDRVGSAPSTRYLMQESSVVQGVLDELEQCAKDDAIAVEDRLLVLEEEDSIDRARDALAFG